MLSTRMIVVVTNIGLIGVENVVLEYIYGNDVTITRKYHGDEHDVIMSKYKSSFKNRIESN